MDVLLRPVPVPRSVVLSLLVVGVGLAGCIGSDEPSPDPLERQDGAGDGLGLLWDGAVIQLEDCGMTYHNPAADRERLTRRLPDGFMPPGSLGPVLLTVILFDCSSVIRDGEPVGPGRVFLAHVWVDDGDPDTKDTTYLLDFATDLDWFVDPLVERGATAFLADLGRDDVAEATTFRVEGEGVSYRLDTPGAWPTETTLPSRTYTLLAGPDGEVAVRFKVHVDDLRNWPVSGAIQSTGGAMEHLLGPVAPSLTQRGAGAALFADAAVPVDGRL